MEKASTVVEHELVTLENSGHALNNAVVLRQIFGELALSGSVEDLKNARLVTNASNWQDELRRVWRREAVLILEDDINRPHRGTTLVAFLDKLDDIESPYQLVELPYERVKLQHMKVREQVDSSLDKFGIAMGSSVKHLTLQSVKLDMNPNQDLLLLLKAKFPNLESLRVDYVVQPSLFAILEKGLPSPGHEVTLDKVTKLELGCTRSVSVQFGNFPNLQHLNVFGKRSLRDLENGPMTIVPGVKQLDLADHIIYDYMSVFSSRLQFSELEHLTARISEEQGDDFIKAHSGTLKTLELVSPLDHKPRANPIQTDFSVLTTLRLWGNVMADLSFLRFTPNLQHLHWDVYGYEKEIEMWYDTNKNMYPLTHHRLITNDIEKWMEMEGVELSKLEYCHLSCDLTYQNIRTLAKWMPHLKTFKAVLDSGGFREVCAQWLNLESLSCLCGSDITDEDIAPPQNVSPDNSPQMEILDPDSDDEEPIEKIISSNWLTDLKDLKRFSFYPECNGSTLSDACVNQGFLQMAQLTKLHIFVSDEFSEASEQLLRERIPDVKILRHNSSEEFECCEIMEYEELIFERNSVEEEEETEESESSEFEESD